MVCLKIELRATLSVLGVKVDRDQGPSVRSSLESWLGSGWGVPMTWSKLSVGSELRHPSIVHWSNVRDRSRRCEETIVHMRL
jgi:hypothetical protein